MASMMTDRPGRQQHDVGGRAGRVGGAGDRDAGVGLLQGRRVVHAVAGHADDVARAAAARRRCGTCAPGRPGRSRRPARSSSASWPASWCLVSPNSAGVEDVRAQAELPAISLAMATWSPVTILTSHAHLAGGLDRGLGVLARRIEQRQHAEELPLALRVGPGHAQRAEAPRGEVVDRLLALRHAPASALADQGQDHLRRALGHLERLAVRPAGPSASVRL